MPALFVAVGIDSSDAHHDVCLLGPSTEPEVRLRTGHRTDTVSSGKQCSVKMGFHCDREARTILHLYAGASRARCDEAVYRTARERRQAPRPEAAAAAA